MRRIPHLARRTFESLRSRPLTPTEQEQVSGWLRAGEESLFWRQQPLDQRHALNCAVLIADRLPGRTDLIRAALLHDIGKRHSHLGIGGRVAASSLALLRLPVPSRWRRYLDHGPLGAADLAGLEAEPIVVAFAAGHHGGVPSGVDPSDWSLLREADGE
jgi:hypothetical protein